MLKVRILLLGLFCLLWFNSPAHAFVIINEFLADPPSGVAGDANRDLTASTSQDEFVELFNSGNDTVDISGWGLADNYKPRHVFDAGTTLLPQSLIVVFGGGDPQDIPSRWQTASTGGLGLNNSGDSIIITDAAGQVVDRVDYGSEANADQSLTRAPQGVAGAEFILHTELPGAEGALFSPGEMPGVSADRPVTATVPEPLSVLTLGLGLVPALVSKRKRM
jgi:hypothetical protein